MKKIEYPNHLQEAGIEGTVIVQIFVDENGDVKETTLIRGVDLLLDQAVFRVIKEVKFKPAKQKGKPTGVYISIPIVFRFRR